MLCYRLSIPDCARIVKICANTNHAAAESGNHPLASIRATASPNCYSSNESYGGWLWTTIWAVLGNGSLQVFGKSTGPNVGFAETWLMFQPIDVFPGRRSAACETKAGTPLC